MIHGPQKDETTMNDDNSDSESIKSIPLSSARSSTGISSSTRHTPHPTPNFFEHSSVGGTAVDSLARYDPESRSESESASMTGVSNRGNIFDVDFDSSATRSSDTSHSHSPSHAFPIKDLLSSDVPSTRYPPHPIQTPDETASMVDSVISTAKRSRPESLLVSSSESRVILGVALVDFNHLIGPNIEWSEGDVFQDNEVSRIMPFLALPDGAHMASEDYSYFHLVPNMPNPRTLFGISCNRQLDSDTLLVRDAEVTRSTVQKAIVVVASKPIFGPIRDKLGVVTRAYFEQRDFSDTRILSDFHTSLESSIRSQLTESTLYNGTNVRALVHSFRHRTLVLLKALLAQRKILFSGHPVEQLCTFQYSLVSLVPGLLHALEDCGSPPLASRASKLARPNSLRTSDRKSFMAYLGLPLDLFGKDAFFQPYMPLQQLDLLKNTNGWLCGTTNSVIAELRDVDILINIETMTLEFRNPQTERLCSLSAADRVWIDEIVRDVNEGWSESDPSKPTHLQFKGSEDYLRTKFEEYIISALSAIRYAQFKVKGDKGGVVITDANDPLTLQHYHLPWVETLKMTTAYQVWDRVTDPMLFDIVEPRHPGSDRVTTISDLGLRLQEGLHDLKLEQQLAPTREALSSALATSSTSFFKAIDGVKSRWTTVRRPSLASVGSTRTESNTASERESGMSTPVDLNLSSRDDLNVATVSSPTNAGTAPTLATNAATAAHTASARVSSWGSGIGSFLSTRASLFSKRTSSTWVGSGEPVRPPSMTSSVKGGTGETGLSESRDHHEEEIAQIAQAL